MDAHRPLPADSELAQAIAASAGAQQDAVWDRTQATTSGRACYVVRPGDPGRDPLTSATASMRPKLASSGCCAHPGGGGEADQEHSLVALLKRAGRKRGIEGEATFAGRPTRGVSASASARRRRLRPPDPALLRLLDAACTNADELEPAARPASPNTPTPRSSPACRAGRVDRRLDPGRDRRRPVPLRRRPIVEGLLRRCSCDPSLRQGAVTVTTRRVKNQRRAGVGYLWPFSALKASHPRPRLLRPAPQDQRTPHRRTT